MINVLLYAEVDLNLIDGSSIWLASLAELLSCSDKIKVNVLLRTKLKRDLVLSSIKSRSNVHFVDPWKLAEDNTKISEIISRNKIPRLHPKIATDLIVELFNQQIFDVVIIRSIETALLLSHHPMIASVLWVYMTDPVRQVTKKNQRKIISMFDRCQYFFCQTKEAKSLFVKLLKVEDVGRIKILPPMIPDFVETTLRINIDQKKPRLGYSGKFSPFYLINEMLDAFEIIKKKFPGAEFHIVGDKFHNSPYIENFEEDIYKKLKETKGVFWYGGVSRDEASKIMSEVHVASSWRDKHFDDSVEMSTKILEYASFGIPVLMNPSGIQKDVFGDDYPCYVKTKEDFINKFLEIIYSPELYYEATVLMQKTARKYTLSNTLKGLMPLMSNDSINLSSNNDKTILFAGHDLKFLNPIINFYKTNSAYNVNIDTYDGHVIKDISNSKNLLKKANIIFCEWALGNAEWYSHQKRDHQKLIIRLHHQEIDLPYLNKINWKNVDKIIFICQRNMNLFLARFPFMKERTTLIYNLFDCNLFDQTKLFGSEFNLGFIGVAPKRKAPHLAVEILQRLKKVDERYTLFIKGKHPFKYKWLLNRPEEKIYYSKFFENINNSKCENSIVFDPHGNDVPDWFAKIGFLLSTSDHEGSHQAVAEGMASGAIPVIRNWAGADLTYPSKYVFKTPDEAVEKITKWRSGVCYQKEVEFVINYAKENFDQPVIIHQYEKLLTKIWD